MDAIADDGTALDTTGERTLSYTVDNKVEYIEVESGGNTYRQTFTYTDGNLTHVSGWVLQA
jgi:hypothetical protein